MRRKDRERSDAPFVQHVLSTADELYVAFATEGAPYVIPLNFVYDTDKIYIHCATEGRKLTLIERQPLVGFTTACEVEILRERSTTRYSSICGTGRARYVTDPVEKQEALRLLALRYNAHCQIPTPEPLLQRTGVICIEVIEITGKYRNPDAS